MGAAMRQVAGVFAAPEPKATHDRPSSAQGFLLFEQAAVRYLLV
jgi:hypothetical protein